MTMVKEGAYRAVDYHYSFAPMKEGKVGWLNEKFPEKREWMTPAEVLHRIKSHKTENKQANPVQPAARPESKSEGGEKPQPESEGRSR